MPPPLLSLSVSRTIWVRGDCRIDVDDLTVACREVPRTDPAAFGSGSLTLSVLGTSIEALLVLWACALGDSAPFNISGA